MSVHTVHSAHLHSGVCECVHNPLGCARTHTPLLPADKRNRVVPCTLENESGLQP